jgi:di/tricarboxylate transporter
MSRDQIVLFAILLVTVGLFLWGRWRHDMVALAALLACVALGIVPPGEAFLGFGHPAVITVACVLVLSQGLLSSGVVDAATQRFLPGSMGPTATIAALAGVAAFLSAFMNNIGALALLLPVALQTAARRNLPPGKVLMPLSFASILGGMTTLIGTPPNLIVSGFRAEGGGKGFGMFDFTPVGLVVALSGIAFVALFAARLVPTRTRTEADGFDIGAYLTEARVSEKSKIVGQTLGEIEVTLDELDAQIMGLIRREVRVRHPEPRLRVRPGDILVIEAVPESLASILSSLSLTLEEDAREKAERRADDEETSGEAREEGDGTRSDQEREQTAELSDAVLMELAVMPGSRLVGRSASAIQLRTRHRIDLLAVSRQGRRSVARLRTMTAQAGDVLLMQGAPEALSGFAAEFGCVPLAKRSLRIPDQRKALSAVGIMASAIGAAATGVAPAAIAFAAGVLLSMALRVVPPRQVYETVDWPVVVLLGALIPVADAMGTTGAADLTARLLLEHIARGHPIVALLLILVVTMTLSDFMNNAATAAVMCPIAIGAALQAGASPDPFLMAVAVGASCAFLTPIGHQNNTLILGPGGFGFGDYWRLGLPLEILVVAVAVPMMLLVWPL